jgi:MFS family permease
MVGVMVMTPVHMGHAGGSEDSVLRVVGLVISVHVAGMYLFSPLVGALGDRVGAPTVVALGGVLLLVATAVSGTAGPADPLQLGIGLLVLGLGWSCGLIAGSTLVTASVGADLRPTAQGGTDLLMGLGAALSGAIGGPLLAWGGFGLVSAVSAALVLPLAVVWASVALRPGQPPPRPPSR